MQQHPKYIKVNGDVYRLAADTQGNFLAANNRQYKIMDMFLRELGGTWQTLNSKLQAERGEGQNIRMDRLMNMSTDDVLKAVDDLNDLVAMAINFTNDISKMQGQGQGAKTQQQGQGAQQIGGSFKIPKPVIKYKGRTYRYAAEWGDPNVTQQQTELGEEAKRLVFNANRTQNVVMSTLLMNIAEAWHVIQPAALAAMPKDGMPSDRLILMFTPQILPALNKLKAELGKASATIKTWQAKLPEVQKRVSQDTVNKV